MRRWDRLLDSYLEEYPARGISPQSVAYTEARLNRWGRWLKGRRPRIANERIDPEMITRYIASCSSFRAKATVYATLSSMRGFGDYLVRQGLWKINPLRWMKGPKVTPYSRLPKRIDHTHMEAFSRAELAHAYHSDAVIFAAGTTCLTVHWENPSRLDVGCNGPHVDRDHIDCQKRRSGGITISYENIALK